MDCSFGGSTFALILQKGWFTCAHDSPGKRLHLRAQFPQVNATFALTRLSYVNEKDLEKLVNIRAKIVGKRSSSDRWNSRHSQLTNLTHLSLASLLWDICTQHSPRCDAAERGAPSGAILFASKTSKNEIKIQNHS